MANLFVKAFTILIYPLVLMPIAYFADSSNIFFTATFVFLVMETLYRPWAYFDWLEYRGWKRALKVFFYSAIITIIWSIFSAGMGFVYISDVFG